MLTDGILDDYRKAKTVCEMVYKYIKKNNSKTDNIQVLREWGQEYLENTISRIHKETGQEYTITTPVTISIDNCVENYYKGDGEGVYIDFNEMKLNTTHVLKVELGVKRNKSTVEFGETFARNGSEPIDSTLQSVLSKLNEIPKKLVKNVKGEIDETQNEKKLVLLNDAIRQFVEAECTRFGYTPIENTTSYRDPYMTGDPLELESMDNQIILGFKRKYSEDEEWITVDNPCCEIEDGDVYNLQIRIVKEKDVKTIHNGKIYNENEHFYTEYKNSSIFRLTGAVYKLRTASGREFYGRIKKRYNNNKFTINEVKTAKDRLGLKDTLAHNLLKEYKTRYIKTGEIVFLKKCTVYYKDGRLHLI
jgi:hypothetical protein